jgi:two-component system sensor histidine kinase/response regulator
MRAGSGAHDDLAVPGMPRRGARVLLVEDDALSQEVACGMLAEFGLHVEVACNGVEALRRVSAEPWDLVLMDIQMPVMDGLEATRQIRALPDRAGLPILAMSANVFAQDLHRCIDAGMDARVPKPVDPAELRAALARWIPAGDAISPESRAGDTRSADGQDPRASQPVARAIDTEVGLSYFGGREAAYRRMLRRFLELRRGEAGVVRELLAAGDAPGAARVAHSLKSIAATVGALELRAASLQLEQAIGADGATRVALAALERQLEAVCEEIAERFPPDAG